MDIVWQDAPDVARQLIGWQVYVRETDGSLTGGVITETEAYTADDAASHSFRGKTARNEVMFGAAGHVYVYFTYGVHWCMNIVTGPVGSGQAVLIRALHLTSNLELVRTRRNNRPDDTLTNGPAKLCQALAVTGADNGAALNQSRFLLKPPTGPPLHVIATERIGISKDTHRLWRFIAQETT